MVQIVMAGLRLEFLVDRIEFGLKFQVRDVTIPVFVKGGDEPVDFLLGERCIVCHVLRLGIAEWRENEAEMPRTGKVAFLLWYTYIPCPEPREDSGWDHGAIVTKSSRAWVMSKPWRIVVELNCQMMMAEYEDNLPGAERWLWKE